METRYPKPESQAGRMLDALLNAKGDWINGQYFLRTLYFSQYHRIIFQLENDYGWKIEHSDFKDEWGFKSYRIVIESKHEEIDQRTEDQSRTQETLFNPRVPLEGPETNSGTQRKDSTSKYWKKEEQVLSSVS